MTVSEWIEALGIVLSGVSGVAAILVSIGAARQAQAQPWYPDQHGSNRLTVTLRVIWYLIRVGVGKPPASRRGRPAVQVVRRSSPLDAP